MSKLNRDKHGIVTFEEALELVESESENHDNSFNTDGSRGDADAAGIPTEDDMVAVEEGDAKIAPSCSQTGSRIIDLQHVCGQLEKGCVVCEKTLFMSDISSEKRCGIASVWQIICRYCGGVTPVHTSKRHRITNPQGNVQWAYNLNTKASVGK